jgi:DNA repair protein RecO (recombination protein O)
LWLTRLTGFLPELSACGECGLDLEGERAFYHALADGLMCSEHKRLASSELSAESRGWAGRMFRTPVATLAGQAWPKNVGQDLRKFLMQIVQRHLDKKLVTLTMLGKLA